MTIRRIRFARYEAHPISQELVDSVVIDPGWTTSDEIGGIFVRTPSTWRLYAWNAIRHVDYEE